MEVFLEMGLSREITMRLALHLSTFNGSAFLPGLFASLAAQTDQDWRLYVRDDGSSAEELEKTRTLVAQYAMTRSVSFETGANIGFSGSHQQLYTQHDEELVLLVNQDVVFTPSYIATVRQYMQEHFDVAVAGGTILRWTWDAEQGIQRTSIVDSLGIGRSRAHKAYDIASGVALEDCTAYDVPVFGISGCLPMIRRAALGTTLFDATYIMYKEDVDVAYRVEKLGMRSARVPRAVAYHFRTFQASILHIGVSARFQELSYRNHWRNLGKHLTVRDWLLDGWAIVPFELAKIGFYLLKNPAILWRTFRYFFVRSV